ncbi:hypothetical protein MKZ38_007281 [Zalerion maritima]|uniref:N-acetylglucosamine-induced protein 1 n=1 Tax=Zalerion maritima TaxID=339359 RepID=A0AAD5RJ26_9PEZI|nr:hypothetical protein MKZ38_007281 [Zalerion maritima]
MRDQTTVLQTCPPHLGFRIENRELIRAEEEFKHLSWVDLHEIIGEAVHIYFLCYTRAYPILLNPKANRMFLHIATNNLDALVRTPSENVRYQEWGAQARRDYGSVMNYLIRERFPKAWGKTAPFAPKSKVPFQDPSDYSVLLNHWPYALEPGIVHLVVWSRTPMAVDTEKGDLLPESRRLVNDFVRRFFVERLGDRGADKVLWFKNWVALQSVRALDHVHVLVKDVDLDIIQEWSRVLDCHR